MLRLLGNGEGLQEAARNGVGLSYSCTDTGSGLDFRGSGEPWKISICVCTGASMIRAVWLLSGK